MLLIDCKQDREAANILKCRRERGPEPIQTVYTSDVTITHPENELRVSPPYKYTVFHFYRNIQNIIIYTFYFGRTQYLQGTLSLAPPLGLPSGPPGGLTTDTQPFVPLLPFRNSQIRYWYWLESHHPVSRLVNQFCSVIESFLNHVDDRKGMISGTLIYPDNPTSNVANNMK